MWSGWSSPFDVSATESESMIARLDMKFLNEFRSLPQTDDEALPTITCATDSSDTMYGALVWNRD
jgi:hypothetical protein